MKKIFVVMIVAAVAFCTSCNNKKHQVPTLKAPVEGADETDSTVYGVCGDGTSMHSLQLITDMGDTIEYMMIDADDNESEVAGGLMWLSNSLPLKIFQLVHGSVSALMLDT